MKYEAVIGLEVHVQVRTASKMFCSCPNRFGDEPNANTCPVCMGYPGVLPVPNHQAILAAIKAGLLTEGRIPNRSKFDRKSYFYPDMPKNYQITQYDEPFSLGGCVRIGGTGFSGAPLPEKAVGLTRIHLEEDVAKLNHYRGFSGVDYNRAGVPLLETVSEPDMRSADEAYAYLTSLKEIFQYGGISDCDMEKGQMRCDVNISLRPEGSEKFGTKVELKNLNSFRAVHRAIDYEISRQSEMLDRGETIRQETRGWDDASGATYLMRTKEEAHDYRYFPDPDLMPVEFSDAEIEAVRASLPELPRARRARFEKDYGLTAYDAGVLTAEAALADYFEAVAAACGNAKLASNWIQSELLRELSDRSMDIAECPVSPERLAGLLKLVAASTINGKVAKELLPELFEGGDAAEIVARKGLGQVSDTGAVNAFVEEVIRNNPAQVAQYLEGNEKVLQYLVGQVMKASRGKANPKMAAELLAAAIRK